MAIVRAPKSLLPDPTAAAGQDLVVMFMISLAGWARCIQPGQLSSIFSIAQCNYLFYRGGLGMVGVNAYITRQMAQIDHSAPPLLPSLDMSDSPYAHYAAVDPEWAALSADAPSVADALADPVAFRNGPEKQFVDFSRQLLK